MTRIIRGTEEQFRSFIAKFPWSDDYLKLGSTIDFFGAYVIPAQPSEIWSLISDTSRLNRCLRIPSSDFQEQGGTRTGCSTYLGREQFWREPPWEWIAGEMMICTKEYTTGTTRVLRCILDLQPTGRGTELKVYYGFIAKGLFNRFLASRFSRYLSEAYERFTPQLVSFLNKGRAGESPLVRRPRKLSDDVVKRINAIQKTLESKGHGPEVVRALCHHVKDSDIAGLYRLRMKSLAQKWQLPYREVLEAALEATRVGLLSLSWDVLCPHCRGVRVEANNLGDIPERANCEVCEMFFSTGKAKRIEVTFHVHPAIRKVKNVVYCAAEAASKPHVVFQLHLKPGASRDVAVELREGRYLLRDSVGGKVFPIDVASNHNADALQPPYDEDTVVESSKRPQIRLANQHQQTTTFTLEKLAWTDDYVRPQDIFGLQNFRDLYTEETIGDNVILAVGEQTILFSDIVGSTQIYGELGDPAAFSAVKQHFRRLFSIIEQNRGAVVKTIGDSVMAAFSDPAEAIYAASQMQVAADSENGPITIRVSLYTGPCLAVNLNTGVDYFGSTVNRASKMQELVSSGEVGIATKILEDPRVKDALVDLKLLDKTHHSVKTSFGEQAEVFEVVRQ